ncbi:MAG: WbqC family protein [Prevotella sp.]|nr:WbqC family protein [Prevotella sp.]
MNCLLSTTYFGPIQWYQKLYRAKQAIIERHESFQKQTYRNRCLIATAQGVQALTVPVTAPANGDRGIAAMRISDHGNWRHLHWQAITSAYGDSPFLEYYEDDLRPFFFERRWEYLFDFNYDICQKICQLIDIRPQLATSPSYIKDVDTHQLTDYRSAISPKHPADDPFFNPLPYYQVFSHQQGFIPNLSILDLLLNMGPESIFYL